MSEIQIDDLIEIWKGLYPFLNRLIYNNIDNHKKIMNHIIFINVLFADKKLIDSLKNNAISSIGGLLGKINNVVPIDQGNNEISIQKNIEEIHSIFLNENYYSNSSSLFQIKILDELINRNDLFVSRIEEDAKNKFKEEVKNFTKLVEDKKEELDKAIALLTGKKTSEYLYGVYKQQADRFNLKIWVKSFFFYLLLIIMFIYGIFILFTVENNITSLATRFIALMPIIWAISFISRSMKEDRKIEQTYRHKEVVARSYKIIISKDNKHKDLQKASFRILMESLGLNPALLLEKSTAEKIPMEELLTRILDKNSEKEDSPNPSSKN